MKERLLVAGERAPKQMLQWLWAGFCFEGGQKCNILIGTYVLTCKRPPNDLVHNPGADSTFRKGLLIAPRFMEA